MPAPGYSTEVRHMEKAEVRVCNGGPTGGTPAETRLPALSTRCLPPAFASRVPKLTPMVPAGLG